MSRILTIFDYGAHCLSLLGPDGFFRRNKLRRDLTTKMEPKMVGLEACFFTLSEKESKNSIEDRGGRVPKFSILEPELQVDCGLDTKVLPKGAPLKGT